jgi:hypothetical protein
MLWLGRIISAIPVVMMGMSSIMKFSHNPKMVEMWAQFGYSDTLITPIATVEILCVLFYLIPQTVVFGAILITGFMGGAVATHLRIGQPIAVPVVLGICAWAGLYLRDRRLRGMLPVGT